MISEEAAKVTKCMMMHLRETSVYRVQFSSLLGMVCYGHRLKAQLKYISCYFKIIFSKVINKII